MISFQQVEFAKAIAPEYISYIGPYYYVNKIHVMCSLINAPICTIPFSLLVTKSRVLPSWFKAQESTFYVRSLSQKSIHALKE